MKSPKKADRGPIEIVEGKGVKIPIYAGKHHGKNSYLVSYYSEGERVRDRAPTLEAAREAAKAKIEELTSGTAHVGTLTPKQTAIIGEAVEIARRCNVPLLAALREFEEARKVLAERGTLVDAAKHYVGHLDRQVASKKVSEAVTAFLESREGMEESYLKTLRPRLAAFVEFFPPDRLVADLGVDDVRRFFGTLKIAPRTLAHNRAHLVALFTFAAYRGWCATNPAEMTVPQKVTDEEPKILTPAEGEDLLEGCSPLIVSGVVLGMFCRLRKVEIELIEWPAVNLKERHVTIGSGVAKTNSRRVVPISENAYKWLKDHAQKSGKVWPEDANLAREHWTLARIQAGFGPFFPVSNAVKEAQEGRDDLRPWPGNALRHSSISYRLAEGCDLPKVAYESGNSPSVIQKHYNGLATPADAKKWYKIVPKSRKLGHWRRISLTPEYR